MAPGRLYRITASLFIPALASCTGQLPGSFRFAQQEETFSSQLEVNTRIDLLFVVDNSASMDTSQAKLRNGLGSFARKYLLPTWDIRIGVITTDTYLAHRGFQNYANSKILGNGFRSSYISSRLGTFVNPPSSPTLVNLATGTFDQGVRNNQFQPLLNTDYARLLPGIHDGPIPSLCLEANSWFYWGIAHCATRDDQTRFNGVSHCLTPSTGELRVCQCVNTVENNTIHSGKAILETIPPAGIPGDQPWVDQLIRDFTINVSAGASGLGSERGLQSLLQFTHDNEAPASGTAFFRENSVRGLIFISDEEDQSVPIVDDSSQHDPYEFYGSTCQAKTVDDLTYTIGFCPDPTRLVAVSAVKAELDRFFATLDAGPANYFVASIVPTTAVAIRHLQSLRDQDAIAVGATPTVVVDRGDRYIELGNLVGNGSLALNIADEDYSPILNAIGTTVAAKKASFTLQRAPTNSEEMLVRILHVEGTTTLIPAEHYTIVGKVLTITDLSTILSLSFQDKISINYQPRTAF